jgi:hypothetical protein
VGAKKCGVVSIVGAENIMQYLELTNENLSVVYIRVVIVIHLSLYDGF